MYAERHKNLPVTPVFHYIIPINVNANKFWVLYHSYFFTLRSGKTCFLIISTSAFCYVKFQCCLEGMSLIFSLEDIECTQIVVPVL